MDSEKLQLPVMQKQLKKLKKYLLALIIFEGIIVGSAFSFLFGAWAGKPSIILMLFLGGFILGTFWYFLILFLLRKKTKNSITFSIIILGFLVLFSIASELRSFSMMSSSTLRSAIRILPFISEIIVIVLQLFAVHTALKLKKMIVENP